MNETCVDIAGGTCKARSITLSGVVMRKIIVVMLFFVFGSTVFSDEIVTLLSGAKILIQDNGTWINIDIKKSDKEPNQPILFTFRKTIWGMDQDSVKSSESDKPVYDKRDKIMYKGSLQGSLVGLSCNILYVFANDLLVRTKYIFTNEHANKLEYQADYIKMKTELLKKYGKPKTEKMVWTNEWYKEKPSEWGNALALGHLTEYAIWETPTTKLTLYILGENSKIEFATEYNSIAYDGLEEAIKSAEAVGDL